MASEENSAYVQHEAARSAEMVELQAQLKRMLARSRDLSIARLHAIGAGADSPREEGAEG